MLERRNYEIFFRNLNAFSRRIWGSSAIGSMLAIVVLEEICMCLLLCNAASMNLQRETSSRVSMPEDGAVCIRVNAHYYIYNMLD